MSESPVRSIVSSRTKKTLIAAKPLQAKRAAPGKKNITRTAQDIRVGKRQPVERSLVKSAVQMSRVSKCKTTITYQVKLTLPVTRGGKLETLWKPFKARPAPNSLPFCPKKSAKPPTIPQGFIMHSTTRAVQRKDFDLKVKLRKFNEQQEKERLLAKVDVFEMQQIRQRRELRVHKATKAPQIKKPVLPTLIVRPKTIPLTPRVLKRSCKKSQAL